METQRSQSSSLLLGVAKAASLAVKTINLSGNEEAMSTAAAALGFKQHPPCQGVLVLRMQRPGVGYTCRLIAPAS